MKERINKLISIFGKKFDHRVYFIRRYPTQEVAGAGGGNNNLETPLLNAPL